MTMMSKIAEEIRRDSDTELAERIEYAKHMKANFQTMIEACHREQERRRIAVPAHATAQ